MTAETRILIPPPEPALSPHPPSQRPAFPVLNRLSHFAQAWEVASKACRGVAGTQIVSRGRILMTSLRRPVAAKGGARQQWNRSIGWGSLPVIWIGLSLRSEPLGTVHNAQWIRGFWVCNCGMQMIIALDPWHSNEDVMKCAPIIVCEIMECTVDSLTVKTKELCLF